jgi:hypothetical protein
VTSAARYPIADEAEAPGRRTADPTGPSGAGRACGEDRSGPGDGGGREWRERARAAAVRTARWWETPPALDLVACLVYLAFAFWLTRGLWPDPATRAIADNVNDQALIEWFLANGATFWSGDFSLVTDQLNAPDGVNLMSNASHILHGVIMAPITAWFGPAVSFALLVAVNLAATASGWYLLLARGLCLGRGPALVGGVFAGFAPGMIAQSNSHLHMTAQWLVPPMVWCVIRLAQVTTVAATIRTAAGLAGLVVAQVFLGEEVLYLTVLTLLVFVATYAACRRAWAWKVAQRFLSGLAIAGGMATIALAYPLWIQFAGRQHTPNAPFGAEFFYADVASFGVFSPLSLAGSVAGSERARELATSSAEYNTFLGLPLILVVLGIVIWRRREPVVIAATVTGAIMTLLSFGPHVTVDRDRTGWPSLYSVIGDLPVISGALPTRYALALIPLIAVLLAYALRAAASRSSGFARPAVPLAVALTLLPVMPVPLQGTYRQPVPEFIASGAWRQCAPEGGVIVPVPLPTPRQPDLMRWPAEAGVAFAIPEGFFIGPHGPGGKSSIGTYPRSTSRLLASVAMTGEVPRINDAMQSQARADLIFWRADCVALAHVARETALRQTLERLIGPGTLIAGTWTWKITR